MNKKGYTIIEAVIAMLLVAVIVTAIFSALMAARRAIIDPSNKEEMVYAVESASNLLKNYVTADNSKISDDLKDGLCGDDASPMAAGEHKITCMLPAVCEKDKSAFVYQVSQKNITVPNVTTQPQMNVVKFSIVCNREAL